MDHPRDPRSLLVKLAGPRVLQFGDCVSSSASGVVVLDRHLRRTRPAWLGAYRRSLCLLPLLLLGMIWQFSRTPPLADDNGLFWRITQHAGAQLLPNVFQPCAGRRSRFSGDAALRRLAGRAAADRASAKKRRAELPVRPTRSDAAPVRSSGGHGGPPLQIARVDSGGIFGR